MLNYVLLKKSQLEDIGEALRYKLDVEDQFLVDDMVDAVLNIGNGDVCTGYTNGFYDVGKYSSFTLLDKDIFERGVAFVFDTPFITYYGSVLTDMVGGFIKCDNDENSIYRIAYYFAGQHTGNAIPYSVYFTFKNFESSKYTVQLIHYNAYNGKQVLNSIDNPQHLNTFTFSKYGDYYKSPDISWNHFRDVNDVYVDNYIIKSFSKNSKVVFNTQEAIDYVLGRID